MQRNLLAREVNDLLDKRQYFWREPVVAAQTIGSSFSFSEKEKIISEIKKYSLIELNNWIGKKETDPGMYDFVTKYWTDGVGVSKSEAATKIKERKEHFDKNKVGSPPHPWSAAFVSYIMRLAYPNFKKSYAHNRYIEWAKENKKTNAHPFQAFKIEEVTVEPGDIICFARDKSNWASYDHVKGKLTHGDIVTDVQNGFATTVGGNVNKNVEEKKNQFQLDSEGKLIQTYVKINKQLKPKYIAIIKLLPYYKKGYTLDSNDNEISDTNLETDNEVITYTKGQYYGYLKEKTFLREDDLKTIQKHKGNALYFDKGYSVELLKENKHEGVKWIQVVGDSALFDEKINDTIITQVYSDGGPRGGLPRTGWIKKSMLGQIKEAYAFIAARESSKSKSTSSAKSIDCTSTDWVTTRDGFKKVHWDITPLKKDREDETTYQTRIALFKAKIHAVLKDAGKNPDDWFDSFTNITFLGRSFNNPIHIELATYLKLIEKTFIAKYGGSSSSAKEAGNALGLSETISGGRKSSETAEISMHTFGLAADIEYLKNPYLGGNIKLTEDIKKAIYILDKAPEKVNTKIEVLNVIFKRAGILINGVGSSYPTKPTKISSLDLYDQLKVLNELTVKYFNLVDNRDELVRLLKLNNRDEWNNITVENAIIIIKSDYDWFRGFVSRFWKVKPKYKQNTAIVIKEGVQSHIIKTSGFLSHDRRFIEDIGLDWGATYGDIMHFDMRNMCVGKIIDTSRKKILAQLK